MRATAPKVGPKFVLMNMLYGFAGGLAVTCSLVEGYTWLTRNTTSPHVGRNAPSALNGVASTDHVTRRFFKATVEGFIGGVDKETITLRLIKPPLIQGRSSGEMIRGREFFFKGNRFSSQDKPLRLHARDAVFKILGGDEEATGGGKIVVLTVEFEAGTDGNITEAETVNIRILD
jgi:hypothetical protein